LTKRAKEQWEKDHEDSDGLWMNIGKYLKKSNTMATVALWAICSVGREMAR